MDLRRIVKANCQLEYQPNLTQFMGGLAFTNEIVSDVFQTQEYVELLRK